jgi:SPP1 gp7 family putative phage head morphogenesis protein
MRNNNYWKSRAKQVEQAAHSYGRDTYASVEKTLRRAHLEIEKQIADWYKRFADNNGIVDMAEARKLLNSKELKELKWDIDDYIKHGQENELDERWMKELENASARYHISRLEALKLRTEQAIEVAFGNELDDIDSMARKVFTESFYHTCYDTMLGLSAGWEIGQVNQSVLNSVVSKPWAVDGKNFSDRIWEQKGKLINEVHQELTRTCVMGEAPDRAIANIAKRFNVSKNQAGRLIMTEQAYFHSAAQKEAFKELDIEQYEIVATLDSHTSDICQDMDGKVFDMKDYEAGVTAPPFHVYCRSVTAPYFDDDFDIVGERAARDEGGETYYVPADTTYPEWKEAFVEGNQKGFEDIGKAGIEQEYRKVIRGQSESVKVRSFDVKVSPVLSTVNEIFLSDEVSLKPKVMHNIDRHITAIIEEYGGGDTRPSIYILAHTDVDAGFGGSYNCIKNRVMVVMGDELVGNLRHELWHWRQAEDYRKSRTISNSDERELYMEWLQKKAKKRVEKLGITRYNVGRISSYAEINYFKGKYDEVEAEYYRSRGGKHDG